MHIESLLGIMPVQSKVYRLIAIRYYLVILWTNKKAAKGCDSFGGSTGISGMDLASGLCALRFPEVCSEQRAMAHLDKLVTSLTQKGIKRQSISVNRRGGQVSTS